MEILGGEIKRNETTVNAMGGTELLAYDLHRNVPQDILKEFQIVSSRKRELDPTKIRIFWCHDLPGDPESEFLRQQNNHSLFHKYVFVSNWQMQQYIGAYGLPWNKCIVLQNAITPIPECTKSKDKINLVYFSTPHRGLDILVPVFEKLCEVYKNIHLDVYSSFNLYGWPARDAPFKNLFNRITEHPNMTNHGSITHDGIIKALQNSHILAYPSTWPETSCLVLLESMSAGLLCVHPNYAALYETAANWTMMYQYNENKNEHAAIFYDVLCNAIEKINTNEAVSSIESTKKYVDIFYSWQNRSIEWQAFLSSLLRNVKDRSIKQEEILTFRTA